MYFEYDYVTGWILTFFCKFRIHVFKNVFKQYWSILFDCREVKKGDIFSIIAVSITYKEILRLGTRLPAAIFCAPPQRLNYWTECNKWGVKNPNNGPLDEDCDL